MKEYHRKTGKLTTLNPLYKNPPAQMSRWVTKFHMEISLSKHHSIYLHATDS